jgi:hypothetical protein
MTRIALAFVVLLLVGPAQAQLRGHGGPVRALAISADGTIAVSGSFDTSAIRWSLSRNAAEQVLRFQQGERGRANARRSDRHRRDSKIAICSQCAGARAGAARVMSRRSSALRYRPTARCGVGVMGPQHQAVARSRAASRACWRTMAERQRVAFTPDGKARRSRDMT